MSRALAEDRHPTLASRLSPLASRPSLDWGAPVVAGPLAVLVGLTVGVGVVLSSPLIALAAAVGAVVAVGAAVSVQVGLFALVAVASLLPFAVIPIRVGVQLTIVDALLGAILVGWLVRAVGRESRREDGTTPPLPAAARLVILYVGIAVAALLAGSIYAPLDGPVVRAFLKYASAILLMLAVVDTVRSVGQVRALVRVLIVCGGLAVAVALLIHAQPRATIVELLSSLSVVGYPSGREILRFRPGPNNTYTDVMRATGTSIDPNVLGGLLMLAGALMLAQLLAPRPVVPRWALLPLGGATVVAMVATDSRSSWLGLAMAWAFLALCRDRRLLLLAIPAALALLVLPVGREMLERLASGFAARDRAAALRLDEYRQAFQLIAAYPLLGVGFAGAPELGTFVGVSSIYLLVGEHTGLVGLGCYLAILLTLAIGSLRALGAAATPEARGLVATLQAPFVAALTAGLFDHYFMNPRFPHMVALFWLYAGLLVAATRLATSPTGRRT